MALQARIVKTATPKLSELAECLMEEFRGMNEDRTGLQNFCAMYFEHVQIAAQTKKGGKEVLEACKSIMRMIRDVSILEQGANSTRGPETLTDQELEDEMTSLLPPSLARIVLDNGLKDLDLKPQDFNAGPARGFAEAMGLEDEYDAAKRAGEI
jgi:hypothetical protein